MAVLSPHGEHDRLKRVRGACISPIPVLSRTYSAPRIRELALLAIAHAGPSNGNRVSAIRVPPARTRGARGCPQDTPTGSHRQPFSGDECSDTVPADGEPRKLRACVASYDTIFSCRYSPTAPRRNATASHGPYVPVWGWGVERLGVGYASCYNAANTSCWERI